MQFLGDHARAGSGLEDAGWVQCFRAFGYKPEGEPHFDLVPPPLALAPDAPYAVFIHATSRDDKLWPEAHWKALLEHEIRVARAAVHDVTQHATCLQRLCGQLAHQRDFVIVRLTDHHVTRWRLREERALELLEQINTPATRALLEQFAKFTGRPYQSPPSRTPGRV